MNRNLFTSLALGFAITASATATNSLDELTAFVNDVESISQPLQPTYVPDAITTGGWKSNWFVGVSGGASNFLGSPLGCDDMFGRLKHTFRANVGKWFTPTVGSRMTFEGFEIKASDLTTQGYRAYHMDMMWNVAPYILRTGYDTRWDIIPYFGVGCTHNNKLDHTPFAISYGVIGQYKVTDRLRLTAELSNITTSKCFDGHSKSHGLGDNILGLTVGVNMTIGENGWRGIIDAGPYIAQNELLLSRNYALLESNREFSRRHSHDQRVIDELKKIIRIEGLLGKYEKRIDELDNDGSEALRTFPKNDYSGLNSLLARLRDAKNGYQRGRDIKDINNGDDDLGGLIDELLLDMIRKDGISDDDLSLIDDGLVIDKGDEADGGKGNKKDSEKRDGLSDSDKFWDAYLKAISSGKQCIGAPVYFFFKIGTTNLTDESQLINIQEIARIATKYNLKVRVIGAADSATGSSTTNKQLSLDRAKRIAGELKNSGVSESQITARGSGGIDTYEPNEANRHTRIELYR